MQTKGLGVFRRWLAHPHLWKLTRGPVAGGVAAGLFAGTIPGPVQFILATVLSLAFRVNLPVALTSTLYSNPFTAVPIIFASYEIGKFVTGENAGQHPIGFNWRDIPAVEIVPAFFKWLGSLGSSYLIGTLILATALAVIGYIVVMVLWREEKHPPDVSDTGQNQ